MNPKRMTAADIKQVASRPGYGVVGPSKFEVCSKIPIMPGDKKPGETTEEWAERTGVAACFKPRKVKRGEVPMLDCLVDAVTGIREARAQQIYEPPPSPKDAEHASRIRPNTRPKRKMNKWEVEYWKRLVVFGVGYGTLPTDGSKPEREPLTFELAHRCTYTPDFVLGKTCYEVKGFMRDDAAVKIKVAAKMFPQYTFVLATKKRGQWVEKVMPK